MLKYAETKHPFYCADENFYHNVVIQLKRWEEFSKDFDLETLDLDLNFLFRYDIKRDENQLKLHLYFMLQRKGIFQPVIVYITEKDMDEINAFLSKCKTHMLKHWEELM